MEIKDIIKPAVVVNQEASFEEAVREMIDKQTNSLLVVDAEGLLIGEVSVTDLLDAILPSYLDGDSIAANFATEGMFEEAVEDAKKMAVKEFMSTDIDPIEMDDGLMGVAAIAIAHHRARVPVVDKDNRPVGIVSRRGLKHIIAKYLGVEDTA